MLLALATTKKLKTLNRKTGLGFRGLGLRGLGDREYSKG